MILSERPTVDRVVDVLSVVLISIATILSAWCGYRSARWSGVQTREYERAGALRIQASAKESRANTLQSVDALLFVEYVKAVTTGQERFANFLYGRFRPETQGAVDAWLAQHPLTNPRAPRTPFAMPQYRSSAHSEALVLSNAADAKTRLAAEANATADNYVLYTVFMASISFIAGVGSRLRFPIHISVVIAGSILLVAAIFLILRQPIA